LRPRNRQIPIGGMTPILYFKAAILHRIGTAEQNRGRRIPRWGAGICGIGRIPAAPTLGAFAFGTGPGKGRCGAPKSTHRHQNSEAKQRLDHRHGQSAWPRAPGEIFEDVLLLAMQWERACAGKVHYFRRFPFRYRKADAADAIAISAAGLHSIRLGAEAAYSRLAGLAATAERADPRDARSDMFATPMPPSGHRRPRRSHDIQTKTRSMHGRRFQRYLSRVHNIHR